MKPFLLGNRMNEVIEMDGQPQRAIATTSPATPADIVLYAMKNGGSIAEIREFMQLQREWEADEARKAFVAAMAEFKKSPPEVVKDKLVGYKNKDGTFTGYMHATIGNVTGAIVAGLAEHGFSHRWDLVQKGGEITVTCILTHKLGHSESTPMSGTKDDSGKKNLIQQVASTITYLQRYTLLLATGIATKDQADDDARTAELDTSLADRWISQAQAAKTVADLDTAWGAGVKEINAANDRHAYTEFKAACGARKKEILSADSGGEERVLSDEEAEAADLARTGGKP